MIIDLRIYCWEEACRICPPRASIPAVIAVADQLFRYFTEGRQETLH